MKLRSVQIFIVIKILTLFPLYREYLYREYSIYLLILSTIWFISLSIIIVFMSIDIFLSNRKSVLLLTNLRIFRVKDWSV